ncbi:GDSL-type esterase/lipase family protein [Pseudodesulfovibrio sediminis]|uniref:Arylesterase n=1 Tax=Pseudodesulfovibrio sediminis TaxID=2810563 RepID=A0ABM7P3Z0_9BACT|nr:GDSL-type esterase/lipase family protein [Pseudodesulfovibrio sediminis]BCS87486.1 arylesterase [Pseudodesulfovibrio sediminis]
MAAVRIACFGDSLTEGYGLSSDEALPAVLEQMLRDDGEDARCLNFGCSGDTFAEGLARIQTVVEAHPDAVILEFGTNDFFTEEKVDRIMEEFDQMVKILLAKNLPILLVGTAAVPEIPKQYKARFDPIFRQIADRYALPLFPNILGCYMDDPSLTLLDGLHPNEQGVRTVASALLPQVKDLINALRT